jgi:hypothetical protein
MASVGIIKAALKGGPNTPVRTLALSFGNGERLSLLLTTFATVLLLAAATGCGGSSVQAPQDNQNNTPPPPLKHVAVTTYHNDAARDGVNAQETVLTTSNVNAVSFGKVATVSVLGDIYAQPLYVPQVALTDGTVHNLIFVATEHDQVYAVDADTHSVVWRKDFTNPPSVIPLQQSDFPQGCALPEVGITGTPAIDTSSSTLYVVVRTKETDGSGNVTFYQRLHAIDLTTGNDKLTPTVITTPADPNGEFGSASFEPLYNNQRAALLLDHGQVYVSWASFCDLGTYQGWIMSFDATTLQNTGGWTPSPDGWAGGIWMGASGPPADENGDIYVTTGNGWSDIMSGGGDVGNGVARLHQSNGQITMADYFIPYNWQNLFDGDFDVASDGPVLFPAQPNSPHPHKVVLAAKDGTVYLLNRDNLGQWQPDNNSQIIQTFSSGASWSYSTPAVYNNLIYYGFYNTPLQAYQLDPTTDQVNTTPASATTSFNCQYPGCSPSISSNAGTNTIVWALAETPTTGDLRAFDANDLSRELWSNQTSPTRDKAGPAVPFGVPTVADGMVFVGAKGELDIYGLLP